MAEVQAESHRYCFCNGFTLSLAFLEEMLPEYVFRRDTIGGAAKAATSMSGEAARLAPTGLTGIQGGPEDG